MAYLNRDGERLFYARAGAGAPALVLVHGFACEHSDWRHQIDHFSAGHLVLALDLRGHGRSGRCRAGFDIAAFGADVAGLIEALALERAVLVGHSMGCRVVLDAARRVPAAVAGVVLVDGSRQGSGDPDAAARAVREAMARAGGARLFVERMFADMFLASSDPALVERIVARAATLPAAVAEELFADTVRWDASQAIDALATLAAPLLVLQSTRVNERREREPLPPGGSSPWLELVRENVPAARIEVLSGAGHFAMLEAPAAVNDHLRAFIDGLDARARPGTRPPGSAAAK
ncbi:MAG: alpha/beta hydrolase [Gammaproteobacteria bacterium]|nr:alpha/beta hydrolase [Gammaproteobacteria bacterium]